MEVVRVLAAIAALVLVAWVPDRERATSDEPVMAVIAVPGLAVDALDELDERGAIGLIVPGAGPSTSQAGAMRALARGEVTNSLADETDDEGGAGDRVRVRLAEAVPRLGDRPLIVVGVPRGGEQRNDRRYPIAVIAPGYNGVLKSSATRIPGLVAVGDVARTARRDDGALQSQAADNRQDDLTELDDRIDDNSAGRLPVLLAVGLAAAIAALGGRARSGLVALAAMLLANVALGVAGAAEAAVTVPVILAAGAAGGMAGRRAWSDPALVGLCLAVVAAYLAGYGLWPDDLALSPLGPTQNSRFYGMSNILETLLLVPVVAGAGLAARAAGIAGWVAVAAAAIVLYTGSRYGAAGGGAVVVAVALWVVVVEDRQARRLVAAALLPLGALAVAAVVKFDEARGNDSHVVAALADGPVALVGALGDRIELSWARLVDQWPVTIVAVAALVGLLAIHGTVVRETAGRRERSLLTAFVVGVVVSLVVNDSPAEITLLGLAGYSVLAGLSGAWSDLVGRVKDRRPIGPTLRPARSDSR